VAHKPAGNRDLVVVVTGLESFDQDLAFGQARVHLRAILWPETVHPEEGVLPVDFGLDTRFGDGGIAVERSDRFRLQLRRRSDRTCHEPDSAHTRGASGIDDHLLIMRPQNREARSQMSERAQLAFRSASTSGDDSRCASMAALRPKSDHPLCG